MQRVLDTIASASHSIQILAYAVQAQDIMQALVDAKQRGVGVQVRTNDTVHIHHDKTIIVDGHTVETGSFNFAASAEIANPENVVVIRPMPEGAKQYLVHWQSRRDSAKAYAPN